MKLSTETKAGILVACSFLGLTGVFVGKKFLDPKNNISALLAEGNPEVKPDGPDSKPEVNGTNDKKDNNPSIVQTNSQDAPSGGIPALPEKEKPAPSTGFPPPLGAPPEAFPGLPPLPGTDLPNQNNGSSSPKPDPLGFPPIPPPTTVGPSSGIPPLPGERPLGNNQPKPPDTTNSNPGIIPLPIPPLTVGGGLGAPLATGGNPPGLATIPPLDPVKDASKPSSVPSRGLGGSEFSPGATPGLPPSLPPIGGPGAMNPGLTSPGLYSPGNGATGLGAPGLAARGAMAVAIPPVVLTTFSPTTGPVKRTEFIPLEEPVGNPMAIPNAQGLPNFSPNPLPTPLNPGSATPPGALDPSGNMVRRPAPGSNPNFALVPIVPLSSQDKPILRMSANETNPRLGTVPLAGNSPKVSSWSEKVFISAPGDTWDSISLAQYQRRDLGRMLQQYNELHPRLVSLPKTGILPSSTEIFLPPLEELIRQGALAFPGTNPQPGAFPTGAPGRP